jgi:hypothetical protein
MNESLKLSIVEMEMAAMWAKIQSMKQTMVKSNGPEGKALDHIADEIDALRRQLGVKIEMMNNQ